MNTLGLSDLLYKTTLSHPLHRARFSEQTWVNQRGLDDPVLNKITERYNYIIRKKSSQNWSEGKDPTVQYHSCHKFSTNFGAQNCP